MPHLLLICQDSSTRSPVAANVRAAGGCIVETRSAAPKDAEQSTVVLITDFSSVKEVMATLGLGAADVAGRPIVDDDALQTILRRLTGSDRAAAAANDRGHDVAEDDAAEAHAAARWARAIVGLLDSPKDPRTITLWSRWIAASPGALRSWCYTAGIRPRRSLVFGRLLRAVVQSEGGRRKPENLLDVVDRRTLVGLLGLAGLSSGEFPCDVGAFLDRQAVVGDPDTLMELRRALAQRHGNDSAPRR